MKITLTEAEKVFVGEFLDKVKDMSDSENNVKIIDAIKNKISEPEIEIKEEYVVETMLRSKFLLDETDDAYKELDCSFSGMKSEWGSLKAKLFIKVSEVFLLKNTWTRSFYNATMYYVASFKEAYNKMLNMNFSYRKESAQDK